METTCLFQVTCLPQSTGFAKDNRLEVSSDGKDVAHCIALELSDEQQRVD